MILLLPPANSQGANKRHFTSSLLHVCTLLILFWDTPLVPHRQIISHSVVSCHYILFLVRLEVFGLCCIHISFEPHHSLFGNGLRPIFLAVSVRLFGAQQGSMAVFTLTQMNRTNRAIAPVFVLIKTNMTSVNTS